MVNNLIKYIESRKEYKSSSKGCSEGHYIIKLPKALYFELIDRLKRTRNRRKPIDKKSAMHYESLLIDACVKYKTTPNFVRSRRVNKPEVFKKWLVIHEVYRVSQERGYPIPKSHLARLVNKDHSSIIYTLKKDLEKEIDIYKKRHNITII